MLNAAISTHAPLTGCDPLFFPCYMVSSRISTHAPLTGCDVSLTSGPAPPRYFNPRTPHGVRLNGEQYEIIVYDISTHAPLTGCDSYPTPACCTNTNFNPRTPHGVRPRTWRLQRRSSGFQPTHPSRGATLNFAKIKITLIFQPTHPSRGATCYRMKAVFDAPHFNPRTPHGVRPSARVRACPASGPFQPTHPSRGATFFRYFFYYFFWISTHAPLTGCDRWMLGYIRTLSEFQPTHPSRGATGAMALDNKYIGISTHAPLTGCDGVLCCWYRQF